MAWAIGSEVTCISLLLVTSIFLDSDRIAGYSMDIDTDSFDIPNTEYHARIIMPAAEFTLFVISCYYIIHRIEKTVQYIELRRMKKND